MITIQDLTWNNWFSFGDNNYINFEDSKFLQIMGKNGAGKTSIALILEEVFYGKNSRGIKKQKLANRNLSNPIVYAKCNFYDETSKYTIEVTRKATIKLKLIKDGKDISSHTTTNTYKTIQEIIGLDFKTFAQLIYQSSKSNLEFLTATDVNRKKFLISLFNLDRYLKIHELFKKAANDINSDLLVIKGKVSTLESWIEKNSKVNLLEKEIEEIPEVSQEDIDKLAELKSDLANITKTNKKINENNQYRELLSNLDTSILTNKVPEIDLQLKEELEKKAKIITNTGILNKGIIDQKNQDISKLENLGGICHSCLQTIDEETKTLMINNLSEERDDLKKGNEELTEKLKEIREQISDIKALQTEEEKRDKVSKEFAQLVSSIDDDIPDETLDAQELNKEIRVIHNKIAQMQKEIQDIARRNSTVEAQNSRIKVIKEQLVEYTKDAEKLHNIINEYESNFSKLELIKKTFSTSGLINYKVDFLVKDLESQINAYLGELSSGRFQLLFVLKGEKLNVEIVDEGMSVDIEELSAGELARINAATLLAIRKLMSDISSTKINILFLDEIMGVLDEEGKEKLIEVLTDETELNTMLVSHEFSHPLIPKITIIKENKVSRIDG